MRQYISLINKLCESLNEMNEEDPDFEDEDFEDDDEEDHRFDALPSSSIISGLKPAMAVAAQKVYDGWIQDEDDDLNGGGICHLIADQIADILGNAGAQATTQSASDVQHVYTVARFNDGIFDVDIPYHMYEHGGGFTWTKIPDVRFTPEDISVYRLDADPARMNIYVDEWEEY